MYLNINGTKEIRMSETTKKAATPRTKRRPFGIPQSRLAIDKQLDGYHYRWINDYPGRISRALEGGYSFVEPSEVGREENGENKVKELAGTQKDGSALFTYLMRISQEFYEEDKAISRENLDAIDEAIKGGRVNQTAADKRYVPKGGISYKT